MVNQPRLKGWEHEERGMWREAKGRQQSLHFLTAEHAPKITCPIP